MRRSADMPELGLIEWFRLNEHKRVEASLERLNALGVTELRTHLSWAEFHRDGGAEWYDWLIPRLARELRVLPCIHYTPPSISETGQSAGPPRRLDDFAEFVDHIITRYRPSLETIELWNEPNNLLDWDWREDPDWLKFCTMIGSAAHWARQRGIEVVLGGPCPLDLNWLSLMGERGVLDVVDVVGLHGFPGTWDSEEATWTGWPDAIETASSLIHRFNPDARIWITETGYSTWRHDEFGQVQRLKDALSAPVERVYWYALQDIPPTIAVQQGLRFDQRHYHFGLYDPHGREKLLARLWRAGGASAVEGVMDLPGRSPSLVGRRPVLVTGGAGFIGSNLADRLAREGEDVLVVDSLARPGVEENLAWLRRTHPQRMSATIADIRDETAAADAVADCKAVFHLAAQVAVTTSLDHPDHDFSVNLLGTFRLLEALRDRGGEVPLIFASTNKVYGDLADVPFDRTADAYVPCNDHIARFGIDESRPLAFHTPYGCSKGAADQYVLDYAHSFGVPTAVFRMSCIYGPRQFGTEDQGWVAHFLIRALSGEPITIFGDGRQVRDILNVSDAVDAYLAAWRRIGAISGKAFNLGGGPENAVSLRQLIAQIEISLGQTVEVTYEPWRPGDQRYYVSDTRRVRAELGLSRPIPWKPGVRALAGWLAAERGLRGSMSAPLMPKEIAL